MAHQSSWDSGHRWARDETPRRRPAYDPPPSRADQANRFTLTEWVFLAGHDERGRRRFDIDVLGAGMATAALIELLDLGAIRVKESGHVERATAEVPRDEQAAYLLDQIYEAEGRDGVTHTAADWIKVMRRQFHDGIALGLVTKGAVKRERGLLGTSYLAQQQVATLPTIWIFGLLRTQHAAAGDVPPVERYVAAIVGSLGMVSAVTPLAGPGATAHLPNVLQTLSEEHRRILSAAAQVRKDLAMTVRR